MRSNPLVPERKRLPTPIPRLEWLQTDDGSLSLYDAALEESYHSGCGAVAETWHVYVCQGGVLSKLQSRTEMIAVLEYGFGTAMGFLLTAAAARVLQAPLRFVSLEKWLLPAPVLEGVHRPLLADPYLFLDPQGRSALASIEGTETFRLHYRQLFDRFIEWRTALPSDCPDGEYSLAGDDGIQLDLRIGDACQDASLSKKAKRSYSMPSISMPSVRNRVRIYGAPRPCGELTLV